MPFINKTPDYIFHSINGKCIKIKIRSGHSGRLALTAEPMESNPIIEIFISESKSLIRKNRKLPNVAEVTTPSDLFQSDEHPSFWVRWTDKTLKIGRLGETRVLMEFDDLDLPLINFVGLYKDCSNGNGFTLIKEAKCAVLGASSPSLSPIGNGLLSWIPASDGFVPPGAIEGGVDNREKLYVARARHNGAWTAGKLHPGYGNCYVAWGGREHTYSKYEVLCIDYSALPGGSFDMSST